MRTDFAPELLDNPDMQHSNRVLRSCVHCGFCTATCPTYLLLGDELDSPRGRIYQIKEMFEKNLDPDPKTVLHIDRCLSCLSCMTTCPSDVHYMHLVDHARAYIEERYRRPLADRTLRWLLMQILPWPRRFRLALRLARIGRIFAPLVPDERLRAMLRMAPPYLSRPSRLDLPQVHAASGSRKRRVALMTGCAQRVLAPQINEATIRLLCRAGCEVVIPPGTGCCGALVHHMGKSQASHRAACANIRAWTAEMDSSSGGLDAIVINASGCGTTVKDYGHMLRNGSMAQEAARASRLAVDITEILSDLDLPCVQVPLLRVAYHSACSLQHGQKVTEQPKALLRRAGFEVVEPVESHICCGSAGTYNIMQPLIAERLKWRKVAALEATGPDVVATGNIGCMVQLGSGSTVPVVHTVELLDWASGGPVPPAIAEAGKAG